MRQYVRARRRQIGVPGEAYVPQIHHPGVEAEVAWGEATVIMRATPIQIGLFYMRACHSGASYVGAFPRMTQQAFLEAHAAAFSYFGGIFPLIRYEEWDLAVRTSMNLNSNARMETIEVSDDPPRRLPRRRVRRALRQSAGGRDERRAASGPRRGVAPRPDRIRRPGTRQHPDPRPRPRPANAVVDAPTRGGGWTDARGGCSSRTPPPC